MKNSQRILALIMSILLCVSLFPAQVFAEDADSVDFGNAAETTEPAEAVSPEIEKSDGETEDDTVENPSSEILVETDETTTEGSAENEEAVANDAAGATIIASGSCKSNVPGVFSGDDLTWTLDDEGTLTISGFGAMGSYEEGVYGPWCQDWGLYIKTVIVEEGVTSIGWDAFCGCYYLESVQLPKGLTIIGGYSFRDCPRLKSITIPDSVTCIESSAFCGCSTLMSVSIPAGVAYIGDYTFYGCKNLTGIEIPSSVTRIEGYAFGDCIALENVTIPARVTSIGDSAFNGCSSLKNLTIPAGVTSINANTFYGCSDLINLTISGSITSIGDNAFYGCSSLNGLTGLDDVTSIGAEAFYGCSTITSIDIGAEVTKIGTGAFNGCSSLTEINVNTDNPNYSSDEGVLFNKDQTILIKYPAGKQGIEYILPSSVTDIEANAFSGCGLLKSVIIGDGIDSISEGMFYGCDGLTSIKISDSVTTIGTNAFSGCSNLNSVTIPDSVTSIEASAFADCSALASIKIPNGVQSISEGVFQGCSSLTDVTIPDSVTSIEASAFANCTALTGLTVPANATYICFSAFNGCSNLLAYNVDGENSEYTAIDGIIYSKNLTTLCKFPAGKPVSEYIVSTDLVYIGDNAFSGCDYLTSITIPANVTSIGSYAFSECINLTDVEISEGVTEIGMRAFYGCVSLTHVSIPASVTSLVNTDDHWIQYGDNSFIGCTSLREINVAEENQNYCSIDGVLFNKDGTELIFFPSGIEGEYSVPETVTKIGGFAFYDSKLSSLIFPGDIPYFAEQYGYSYMTFVNAVLTAYYPKENTTWRYTAASQPQYGGTITWMANPSHIHIVETDEPVSPTCTETGLTEGSHCSVCNEVLVAQEEIPALGHLYDTDPTFTWSEDGTCTIDFACSRCDYVNQVEGIVFSRVKTKATCTEAGVTQYMMSTEVDGKTYTDTHEEANIPATGHTWGEWTTDPDTGDRIRTCTVCGETETDTTLYGDVNGDEKVTLIDLLLLKSYLAGNQVTIDLNAADMNLSGEIRMDDLLLLKQKLADIT